MITKRRSPNGIYYLKYKGVEVGVVIPVARGFSLKLNGIYWKPSGEPSQKGGTTMIHFPTLKDAIEHASMVLQDLLT